ncbi:MAG: peptide transporter substrate-binding protein [Enterovirga sp.]|jgi:peptide/nickel transport system substrate-binding protein|nr:peptide transporter substrate-binding protein [Enterovirga sp.]
MKTLLSNLALAGLMAWGGPALAGKADDTLNVAFGNEATTMDTYKETTREGNILARLLYDCLIEKDTKTGEFKPAIASSYKIVDDKTLEFEIRPNVKFHNGETLTVDDVVYTFNLVSSKEYGARYQIAVDWIDRAEKVGDSTVRLHMKRPYPMALEMLAGNLPVYPKAYYEKVGPSGMATKPVGAGPYRLVDITPGARFVFERFEDYYAESPKGRPAIKRVIVRTLPETNTQYAELMNGGLDWVWRVSPDDARNLTRRSNLEVKGIEILRYAFVSLHPAFQDGKSPLADVRVRRALNHAVNRPGILKAFVGGAAQVTNAACSHLQFGCTDQVAKYDYDLAKAKALLAEAGYPNGFSTEMLVSSTAKEQAEAIAANLGAVGVKVTLNFQQYAPALSAWREGRVPLFLGNWGSYGIADVGLGTSQFFAGTADDLVKDPEIIPLLKAADTSMDRDVRKQKYEQAVKLIAERAYIIPLWTFNVNTASNKDLDFSLGADEYARFYEAKWK